MQVVPLQEVADNANKATSLTNPRTNQYVVKIPNDGSQNGMPMFKDVKNIVKMTIVHNVYYNATVSSGETYPGVGVSTYDMFIVKTKKSSPGTGISWEDLDNNSLTLTVPNGVDPKTRTRLR